MVELTSERRLLCSFVAVLALIKPRPGSSKGSRVVTDVGYVP
jgi:hypothetical protein